MVPKKLASGDLLFHPVHGLCRVERVTQEDRGGKKEWCYALVPKVAIRMKVRFVVAASDIKASGFHGVLSKPEAKKVLDYLKAGKFDVEQTQPAWILARNILTFSVDRLKTRDQRKRQLLDYSIKGLVGELACVFRLSLKEAAARIEKNLAKLSKNDPLVLAALERATE